jgi:uncharacterized protein (TIGR02001 family)
MRKLPASVLLALIIASPFVAQAQAPAPAAPAAAPEPTPIHTFVPKISLYSEYEFRGITQTSENPALQVNLDYTHASGFYLGLFVTNIKWLKETATTLGGHTRAGVEVDIFGGYRKEIFADTTIDVGYLRYEYPRSKDFYTNPKVNTDEVYAGITWKWLNAKVSYAFSDAFGVFNSEGSTFVEANIAYPWSEKLTLTGHIGHQKFENNSPLDYTVYKLGFAYDFGDGWVAGAYYKDTDAEEALYTYYGKNWGRSRGVAFVSKAF